MKINAIYIPLLLVITRLCTANLYAQGMGMESVVFSYSIDYKWDNGDGTHHWQLKIKNETPNTNIDNSGTKIIANTGNIANQDYAGDSLEFFWDNGTTNIESDKFEALPIMALGYIDSTARDPNADELLIDFDSPYDTLVDSEITVIPSGYESGEPGYTPYIISAKWPGPVTYYRLGSIAFSEAVLTNSLKAVSLNVETTNYISNHRFCSFRIASTTDILSGLWTTNSTLHSITGAVTRVSVTNSADCVFFKVVE